MTNYELYYFLGKCLALGKNTGNDKAVVEQITRNEVDWECFVALADGHLVLPSVYLRFKRNNILPLLPEALRDCLLTIYELNCERNKTALEQIDKINLLFATVGIAPIYLKGAANLLDSLYEDVGERIVGDIDVLVSEAEFLPAVHLLKNEGYEHLYEYDDGDRLDTKHFPRLVHPVELLDVEVHRSPVDVRFSPVFNYATVYPEIKRVETKPPCFVLSDRHKVILNFMHGFMSTETRQTHLVSFRNMIDLLFLSQRVDVFDILSRLERYSSKAGTYACFVFHVLGLPDNRLPSGQTEFFISRHNLFLQHPFLFRTVWVFNYLTSRIWSSYVKNFVRMLFNKRFRKSQLRRITCERVKAHFKSYKTSFERYFS